MRIASDTITFGKYRDTTLERVVQIDPAYALWMHRTLDNWKLPTKLLLDAQMFVKEERRKKYYDEEYDEELEAEKGFIFGDADWI
jgi:hypothetical protein